MRPLLWLYWQYFYLLAWCTSSVSFTDAATQEIKDRVRSRIIDARDALLGQVPNDELIEGVIAGVDDKHRAFDLLDAAAKSMDEAAIFTIHGFCQRMLKQHSTHSRRSQTDI